MNKKPKSSNIEIVEGKNSKTEIVNQKIRNSNCERTNKNKKWEMIDLKVLAMYCGELQIYGFFLVVEFHQ